MPQHQPAAEPNALIDEASPYLRQHAHNPVHWLPWGDRAFAEARQRGVPVLVSIGYSTCHWCHVMAHESFEDPATAAIMNELFVCVKVDREEHPEVDEIYMDAVQALTGHGGWPLNAFTDHDGRPFYALTYLPREQWRQLLTELARLWREDRPRIDKVAAQIVEHLVQEAPAGGAIPATVWDRLREQCARTYDAANPGYAYSPAKAPKFPASQLIPLLMALGDEASLREAEATLEAMQDSGLHDRVGGGFHRYSVDAQWRVPHFEKMLYDNALLIVAYARGGVQFARADFLRTAVNAGDYLLRDLRVADAAGAFAGYASAEDADDPDGEGSFYAWSPDQLAAVLGGDEAARLAAEWDIVAGHREVGPSGHPEPVASHIPHPRGAGVPDGEAGIAARARWEPFYPRLRAVRDARPRPSRDDKVLTDLNGLALEAFAALARYAEPADAARFAAAARELATLMIARQTAAGLVRMPGRPAFITDYGHLAMGLTAASDALGDPALIDAAARIVDEAVQRLRAEDGGFFTTPAGRADLVRRSREQTDNAYPAGQNALSVALMRLWNITGVGARRAVAEGVFSTSSGYAQQAPTAVPTLLQAWLAARRGHLTAVIAGPADDERTTALTRACRRSTIPSLGIVPVAASGERDWPALEGRRDLPEPQALICVGTVCLAPARTAAEVAARLDEAARMLSR